MSVTLTLTQAQIDAISLALHIAIDHTETRLEAVVAKPTQERLEMLTQRLDDLDALSRMVDGKAAEHSALHAPVYWS
jgi:hypothetical protein